MSVLHRDLERRRIRGQALLHALYRQDLAETAGRLEAAEATVERERGNMGRAIQIAVDAGLSMTELSELTGIPRQRLYEWKERYAGAVPDFRQQIIARLTAEGAVTAKRLGQVLGTNARAVQPVLDELISEGLVHTPVSEAGPKGKLTLFYGLTEAGESSLREELARSDERRFAVYLRIDPDEGRKLLSAAVDLMGGERTALIEPGTVSSMSKPELAFHVLASTGEEAGRRAIERMHEIRSLAGLSPAPAELMAVAPAD